MGRVRVNITTLPNLPLSQNQRWRLHRSDPINKLSPTQNTPALQAISRRANGQEIVDQGSKGTCEKLDFIVQTFMRRTERTIRSRLQKYISRFLQFPMATHNGRLQKYNTTEFLKQSVVRKPRNYDFPVCIPPCLTQAVDEFTWFIPGFSCVLILRLFKATTFVQLNSYNF